MVLLLCLPSLPDSAFNHLLHFVLPLDVLFHNRSQTAILDLVFAFNHSDCSWIFCLSSIFSVFSKKSIGVFFLPIPSSFTVLIISVLFGEQLSTVFYLLYVGPAKSGFAIKAWRSLYSVVIFLFFCIIFHSVVILHSFLSLSLSFPIKMVSRYLGSSVGRLYLLCQGCFCTKINKKLTVFIHLFFSLNMLQMVYILILEGKNI